MSSKLDESEMGVSNLPPMVSLFWIAPKVNNHVMAVESISIIVVFSTKVE
ncbi:hypothetical protein Scep_026539 [Stephania cephalantha]|uniref:Uncharacterized protein n=1 Tax=Stephania cephalantha TaxID=152367 RepID=A0AAP0HTE6_9MAGN